MLVQSHATTCRWTRLAVAALQGVADHLETHRALRSHLAYPRPQPCYLLWLIAHKGRADHPLILPFAVCNSRTTAVAVKRTVTVSPLQSSSALSTSFSRREAGTDSHVQVWMLGDLLAEVDATRTMIHLCPKLLGLTDDMHADQIVPSMP